MSCRKIRERLNTRPLMLDEESRRHLENCPECAAFYRAMQVLDDGFKAAREQDEPTTPVSELKIKVERKLEIAKETSLMTQIKEQLGRRPTLAAGMVLAVLAFLFITLVPFSYTTTVGYNVIYSDLEKAPDISTERLAEALGALGYDRVNVNLGGNNCELLNLPSYRAAEEAAVAFTAMTGISVNPRVEPIEAEVSGSLYAQVLDKRRTIEITAVGGTEEEIEQQIRDQLAAEGFLGADVNVSTGDSGITRIDISMPTDDVETGTTGEMRLQIADNQPTMSIGMPEMIDVDTEGKTVAQVKAEIEARLAARGMDNAKVMVTEDPSGKMKIEVNFDENK